MRSVTRGKGGSKQGPCRISPESQFAHRRRSRTANPRVLVLPSCSLVAGPEIELHIHLNLGKGRGVMYDDLTEAYVSFNKGDVTTLHLLGSES